MESILDQLQATENDVNELQIASLSDEELMNPLTKSSLPSDQEKSISQQLVDKEEQISKITTELDSVILKERTNSDKSSKAIALCEAKAAATRRYTLELQTKLRDRDSRIGNLEDTVDALSGRIESEISRGEKLGAQNISLKDHLEKQNKAFAATSSDEIKTLLSEANARCCALETKLGGLSMDHRATQRKMAKELDSRVRAMDTLRSSVEADVKSLNNKNDRLLSYLSDICHIMREKNIEIPSEVIAELGQQQQALTTSDDSTTCDESTTGIESESGRTGRTKSRSSRSPSPFRKFMGKRAASPGRTNNNKGDSVASGGGGNNTDSQNEGGNIKSDQSETSANKTTAKPAPFRRWNSGIQNTSTNNETNLSGKSKGEVSMKESGTPTTQTPSAPPRSTTPGEGIGSDKSGSGGNMTDLLQDRRNSSREVAAQKHAARLKAVRTSSRGKWGFSV